MGAEHFAQGLIEQVGGCVVGFAGAAGFHVNAGHKFGRWVFREFTRQMDGQVVFALRVEDFNGFLFVAEHTAVAHLSAHFGVERCRVEHEFKIGLLLLLHLAVAQDVAGVFREVPAFKFRFAFAHHNPVACFHCGGVAGTFLLLFHFGVEGVFINGHSLFGTDELRKVERETIGVEEREGLLSVHHGLALFLRVSNDPFEHGDTR